MPQALLLVSPPAQALDGDALCAFEGEVFIAVGDRDQYAPSAELEALAERAGAQLALLDETDHFFASGTADLGRAIDGWLQRVVG